MGYSESFVSRSVDLAISLKQTRDLTDDILFSGPWVKTFKNGVDSNKRTLRVYTSYQSLHFL